MCLCVCVFDCEFLFLFVRLFVESWSWCFVCWWLQVKVGGFKLLLFYSFLVSYWYALQWVTDCFRFPSNTICQSAQASIRDVEVKENLRIPFQLPPITLITSASSSPDIEVAPQKRKIPILKRSNFYNQWPSSNTYLPEHVQNTFHEILCSRIKDWKAKEAFYELMKPAAVLGC